MRRINVTILVFSICISGIAYANSYTGNYSLSAEGTTVTLKLDHDPQGNITGFLTSTAGERFVIEGVLQEGVAVGICSSVDGSSVYFEAEFEGSKLIFTLVEPDMFGMPDYNNPKQLIFTRSGKEVVEAPEKETVPAAPPAAPPGWSTSTEQAEKLSAPSDKVTAPPAKIAPRKRKEPVADPPQYSSETVSDPGFGFKFNPPVGWNTQKKDGMVYLGHDSIPGIIIVKPHMDEGAQNVQAQMQGGLQEEGTQLNLMTALESIGNNAFAGYFEGIFDSQQAKARGIGTASPYGGGAYIVGVSTPEKFGKAIAAAADAIAKSMQYVKVDESALMQHFAGKWTMVSKYTQTKMYFAANGQYYENYESSYGGDITKQYGDTTATWLAGGAQNSQGRWTVRGNKHKGVIIIFYNTGNEYAMEYGVHVENGKTYFNEYYFDGKLYGKSGE